MKEEGEKEESKKKRETKNDHQTPSPPPSPKTSMKKDYEMCVECEDVPAIVLCLVCEDKFCGLCFEWIHKKGKRASHSTTPLQDVPAELRSEAVRREEEGKKEKEEEEEKEEGEVEEGTTAHFEKMMKEIGEKKDNTPTPSSPSSPSSSSSPSSPSPTSSSLSTSAPPPPTREMEKDVKLGQIKKRSPFIPLRLTADERVLLHILEGALDISEYTDNVDVSNNPYGWNFFGGGGTNKKEDKMKRELYDFFSYIHGLVVCSSLRKGKKLIENKTFKQNSKFLQTIFEIGRRYKIMNPEKMRATYGKLMYILMDTASASSADFNVIQKIKTVGACLNANCPDIFNDKLLCDATCTVTGPETASLRENAREELCKRFVKEGGIDKETLMRCFDSICDADSYIMFNQGPVDAMIKHLKSRFPDKKPEQQIYDLSIKAGIGGSKLTNSHETQFQFVLQTLHLWREIQGEMMALWMHTDADLLSTKHSYRLMNTGQGMQRVQPAPHVSKAMSSILGRVQKRLGSWVGLSVVHLGDRDVPNALTFIDKYTQVPRILGPFTKCIFDLEEISNKEEKIRQWIKATYGGTKNATRWILRDYFRHGFDGSGDDGGSCVDGRLTSSWNWCSKLEKKKIYPLFLLTGFIGFNGDFRK